MALTKPFSAFLRIYVIILKLQSVKIRTGVIFIILLMGLSRAGDVYANSKPKFKPKAKAKTSCTVIRTKYTVSDQIEYRYGVVIGQNVATITSKRSDSQDVMTGLMAGLAAQVIWPKGFVFQPEVLYSQKGCMFSGSGLTYGIDYLEVPVKAMYRLHMSHVQPFVFAAPYGAYAFKLTENGNITTDDMYSSQIRRLDYGIGVGGGFDVWKIQIAFKYSWGFAQVLSETFPVRSRVFTISAGFFL